jgi:hypothetical protein
MLDDEKAPRSRSGTAARAYQPGFAMVAMVFACVDRRRSRPDDRFWKNRHFRLTWTLL